MLVPEIELIGQARTIERAAASILHRDPSLITLPDS
jgi:hypothetical protein